MTGTTKVLGKSKEHSAAHVTHAHVPTPAPSPAPAAKGAKRIWSIFSLLGTGKQALAGKQTTPSHLAVSLDWALQQSQAAHEGMHRPRKPY